MAFFYSGPPTQPTAPLEIVALGPHSIMVEWGAPESDGGAPLEGYKVSFLRLFEKKTTKPPKLCQ